MILHREMGSSCKDRILHWATSFLTSRLHIAFGTLTLDTGRGQSVFKYSTWDALFVLLAAVHGCAFVLAPSVPLIAIGLWWNSNTIAHNFLHKPFFKGCWSNRLFSAYLTLLLGVPQRIWKDRHLAHHAEKAWRMRVTNQLLLESILITLLWTGLLLETPAFFLRIYLPGWILGLGLCQLQGYYEHARGTTSHYSRLYNFLFFNDGFHVEHHAHPNTHWTALPNCTESRVQASRWPPCLRWLDEINLVAFEKLALRSRVLQRFLLTTHARAMCRLLPQFKEARTVVVVGGALFPRSALILEQLLPKAELKLTIVDQNLEHIRQAVPFLGSRVNFVHEFYSVDEQAFTVDLVVIPLSFNGNRSDLPDRLIASAIERGLKPPLVLIHDWIWQPRGRSAIVSFLLLKRLNLVQP